MDCNGKNCEICDVDQLQLEQAERSELGRELAKRLTPIPTSKMLMVANPTNARDAYFDYKENI